MEDDVRQRRHEEYSRSIQNVLLALLASCLFAFLAVGAPDTALVGVEQAVNVPFIGVKTSFVTLLVVLPIILIGIYVYLHLLVGFWLALDEVENEQMLPFLFNLAGPLPRQLSAVLFYWLVPGTLAALTWKALPHTQSWALLVVTVAVAIAAVWLRTRRSQSTHRWRVLTVRGLVVAALLLILWGGLAHRFSAFAPRARLFRGFSAVFFRPLNLYAAHLSDQDLSAFLLVRAVLIRATLKGAILTGTDLTEAVLDGADLTEANLTKARLDRADLTKASLYRANLTKAVLARADLTEAVLDGANLTKAVLYRADLTKVRLPGGSMVTAQLADACSKGGTSFRDDVAVDLPPCERLQRQ